MCHSMSSHSLMPSPVCASGTVTSLAASAAKPRTGGQRQVCRFCSARHRVLWCERAYFAQVDRPFHVSTISCI